MSEPKPEPGTIAWHDLAVPDAGPVRDFYMKVVGWQSMPVSMGSYEDYGMATPATGTAVAGVCHARGTSKDLPAQWLMYVIVADVETSARKCTELGGKVVAPVRPLMDGRFCVIKDPAGAVLALYQSAS